MPLFNKNGLNKLDNPSLQRIKSGITADEKVLHHFSTPTEGFECGLRPERMPSSINVNNTGSNRASQFYSRPTEAFECAVKPGYQSSHTPRHRQYPSPSSGKINPSSKSILSPSLRKPNQTRYQTSKSPKRSFPKQNTPVVSKQKIITRQQRQSMNRPSIRTPPSKSSKIQSQRNIPEQNTPVISFQRASAFSRDKDKNDKKNKNKIMKLFKAIKKMKKSSKVKHNTNIHSVRNRSRSRSVRSLTVITPSTATGSSTDSFHFSSPTEGFECILDDAKMAKYDIDLETSAKKGNSCNVGQAYQCSESNMYSPFDNWESFVSILTSTNESMQQFLIDYGKVPTEHLGNMVDGAMTLADSIAESALPIGTRTLSSINIPENEKDEDDELSDIQDDNTFTESSILTGERSRSNNNAMTVPESAILAGTPTPVSSRRTIKEMRDIAASTPQSLPFDEVEDLQFVSHQEEDETEMFSNDETIGQAAISSLPFEATNPNAPSEELYDSAFTLEFLRDASTVGIWLTFFDTPTEETDNDASFDSILVNMTVKPGVSRGSRMLEPKLYWAGMDDDSSNSTKNKEYCISLLGIDSICTSLDAENDETQYFTITSDEGVVFVFEAPTVSEKYNIVNGIKNVVAWLSYHLVMGNMASGTQLVSNLDEEQGDQIGELPSLKTPTQAMNELSHSFLD
mmetsp:Transcript_7725/g.8840  ORF Transcript_7725/g.8840 Transcript_7725/m.8840 type:complete len:683 (+) Transcript_7725:379-2427(+)